MDANTHYRATVDTLDELETLIAADTTPMPDEMPAVVILSIAHSMLTLLKASLEAMSDSR